MPEVFCNTSPLQYLHQLDLLHVFRSLAGRLVVPPAVVAELEAGRRAGVNLPAVQALDWIEIRSPSGRSALPLIRDLGAGEAEVLLLALETEDSVVVLDDLLGRQIASSLKLRLTGTLGLLLDAKNMGLLPAIVPVLNRLQDLRFRLSAKTRLAVLERAGEA